MGEYKKYLHIKEVLKLYQNGETKKNIALKFKVTEKTVGKWINDSQKIKISQEERIVKLESEVKALKDTLNLILNNNAKSKN